MRLLLNGISGPLGLFMVIIALILIYSIITGIKCQRTGKRVSMFRPIMFVSAVSGIGILGWAIVMTNALGSVPAEQLQKALVYTTDNLFAVLAFAVFVVMVLYGVRVLSERLRRKD